MQGELPATVFQDRKGTPILPPERFSNHEEVKTYTKAMVTADEQRSHMRSRIDGLINGNPPINPAALAAKKLNWSANVNYMEADGYLQAPKTAFYDLVTEVNPMIEITLGFGEGQEKKDWEECIAKHWTWLMLSRWRKGFNYHVPMCQGEMLTHGLGAHVWQQAHINNWIENTPRAGEILFPEDTSVDFDTRGEAFQLREFIPTHLMYGFIKNESSAEKLGWNPKAVWKALSQVSKSYRESNTGENVEQWTRRMKQGDRGGSMAQQSGLWVNWLFVREIDTGKISLYAVAENTDAGDYLFKKRNLYDEWPLALFPYDIGNGTLHSIRGLGSRVKDFFELSNRIKNTMANQVIIGALVLLKQTGTVDPAKLKLLKLGMMGLLPQNTDIAQGLRFPDLSQGPLALDAKLNDTLIKNTQTYAGGSPEAKDRETAISYMSRAQDSAKVSKGAHGLYGSNLCHYWSKKLPMVVRASRMGGDKPYIKMAKEFMARCERDNVPTEAFDHIDEIREIMSMGAGSAAARLQAMMVIMEQVFPNTTDDRRVNILRDLTAAAQSGARVDRYAPSLSDQDMATDDDSIITLENNALVQGGEATVAPHQNQSRHAQGHLQSAAKVAQAVQQEQMPPEQGLAALQAHGQHIGAHLQELAQSPIKKGEASAVEKELRALATFTDKLQIHIESTADQPDPQQQMTEKGQIDLMKAQSQERVRDLKAQGHEQRAWRQVVFAEKIKDIQTAHQINRSKTGAPA